MNLRDFLFSPCQSNFCVVAFGGAMGATHGMPVLPRLAVVMAICIPAVIISVIFEPAKKA